MLALVAAIALYETLTAIVEKPVVASALSAKLRNTPLGPPSTPAASPCDPNPWHTRQTCTQLGYLSEICVYDGPVCVDGEGFGVHIPSAHEEAKDYYRATVDADSRRWSIDPRLNARPVRWSAAGSLSLLNREPRGKIGGEGDGEGDAKTSSSTATDFDLDGRGPHVVTMRGRQWGPTSRWTGVSGVPWEAVVGASSPADIAALGSAFATAAATCGDASLNAIRAAQHRYWLTTYDSSDGVEVFTREEHAPVPSHVTWVHDAAYLVELSSSWHAHIWHFATAAMWLWAAKRENASAATFEPGLGGDGEGGAAGHGPRFHLAWGAVRNLPPMDTVVFLGDYEGADGGGGGVTVLSQLPSWMQGMWPLLSQRHSWPLFNGNLRAAPYSASADRWVCFPRAVAGSVMPALFSGGADAAAFRAAAYAVAGVTRLAAPLHPPRALTIIQRYSRGFHDLPAVLSLVETATAGLPVGVVTDLEELAWGQQVALMAGTGILLTTHGGALTNIAFMPRGAVVIEVMPFLVAASMYAELAAQLGLRHYRLVSSLPPRANGSDGGGGGEGGDTLSGAGAAAAASKAWAEAFNDEFRSECDPPGRPVSALNAALKPPCTAGMDTSPVFDPAVLAYFLGVAMDDIGCRRGVCEGEGADGRPSGEFFGAREAAAR